MHGRFVRELLLVTVAVVFSTAHGRGQDDSLYLVSPLGGEIFYTNRVTSVAIQWAGVSDSTLVRIEWSDDGLRWNLIADSVAGRSYDWDIAGLAPAATYQIRVLQVRAPRPTDNVLYTGHNEPLTDGAWAPDGRAVVTVASQPHIWNPAIGGSQPLNTLPTPTSRYTCVQWSANGERIVLGTEDAGAYSVATQTNTTETTMNIQDEVRKVVLASSGNRLLVVSADNRARLYNLPASAAVRTFSSTTEMTDAGFDADASRAFTCASDVRIYALSGGAPVVCSGHNGDVLSAQIHPDGQRIITIGSDATIRMWNANTGAELWKAEDPREGARSVAISPNGELVAVGMSDSTITVWKAATGELFRTLKGVRGSMSMVQWSPNGDSLIACGNETAAHLFRVSDGVYARRMQHTGRVSSARWSPDGAYVLTTSVDNTAVVWRVADVVLQQAQSQRFSIVDPPPAIIYLHATGDTVAIADTARLQIRLTGEVNLALADVDSLEFRVKINGSILHFLQSTIPVTDVRDSSVYTIYTLAPVAIPPPNGLFGTLTFRATLGTDTITHLAFTRVTQIGNGAGARIETVSDPTLIRGLCRETDQARLYNPIGTALNVWVQDRTRPTVKIQLAENGPVTMTAYSVTGECRWQEHVLVNSSSERTLVRDLSPFLQDPVVLFVIQTASTTVTRVVSLR